MLLAMIATPIWADHDIGKFNKAVCFAKLAEEFDRSPAEVDLAFAMIRDRLQLNKALADLLRDDGMDWNLFKESFVSGEAGLRKLDAAFYTLVLQRIGLPAENIFFVDDKANNVDAARALGIQGAVYTSIE
ncbi:hypothetical protein N7499_011022 [Penicillium canescens]|nr:hypothetical protein N7499_011022 [Penicillium canescens]KAJ6182813.1 hypothetical protein N7485_001455 [Penicillium canescens]